MQQERGDSLEQRRPRPLDEQSGERKSRDVRRLVEAEHAARVAGESTARWWRELTATSASARTEGALDDLLRSSFMTMKAALNADAISVLLANEAGDELVARASNGLSEEVTLGLGIHIGQGMAGRVMVSRRPLLVEDLSKIEVVSPVLRHSGLRSIAAVPILLEGRLLGVVYVGSRNLAHFDDLDIELLELMAERLATALERVAAFEAERTARLRAERDADHLARLQAVTSRLFTATSPEEVAAALTSALSGDAPAPAGSWAWVWLDDESRLVLVPNAAGLRLAPRYEIIEANDNGPLGRAARSGLAVFSDEAGHELELADGDVRRTSSAALPLMVRGRCVGVVVVARDETHVYEDDERDFLRSAAEQAAQAVDRVRLYAEQVALAETNSFLAQAAKAIAEGSDFKDTLDRLASLMLAVVGDICLIDVVGDDGGMRRMVAHHRDRQQQPLVDRLAFDAPDPHGDHPAAHVIRTGETRWSADMTEDFLQATTRDEGHFSVVKALRFRSYVAVPLRGESGVLGALTVVSVSRALGPGDVAFAERLAGHVAAVVDNAQRYEATLQTSQILQQSLLPRSLPDIAELRIAVRYLPATRGLEVGGDFYDLVPLPNGRVSFLIGDVAGHDREAAALMGQLRSAARVLVGQVSGPFELAAALQSSWGLLGFDRIATALFGQLELLTGKLVLASAGHEQPLLVERGEAHYLPVRSNPALGVTAGPGLSWEGRLAPGQVLVLYTDGAIEERNMSVGCGLERLAEAAAEADGQPEAVCERIVAALPAERHDDVALLALALDRGTRT